MSNNPPTLSFHIDVEIGDAIASHVGTAWITALETAAIATLTQQEIPAPASLTLLLTDDAQLQQLNNDYRGFDKPTDVLSFESGEEMPGIGLYLGDIAISIETAAKQASAASHTLLRELQLLTIHGVLHLLGHDHAEPEEKETMWAAQNEIWNNQAE